MTFWLLNLHRWLAILFALPLAILIVTGLILSFEPSVTVGSVQPGRLNAAKIEGLIAKHDPAGKARGLSYRSYDGTLTIGGGRGAPGTIVDIATGERVPGPGALSGVFGTSRFLHEHLIVGGWLVTASTIAMLLLIGLGLFMGWPRFAHSLSGWHKGTAWIALPLLILSPLTGLALAFGITFVAPLPGTGAQAPANLANAVRAVGKDHDLSGLLWLRERRGQMLARIVEDGEYKVYAVTAAGTQALPRQWPRLLHEGNWMGHVSAGLNVITSVSFIILFVTGLWIWARRQLRRRRNIAARAAMPA
jgi:PepSY-associated TM region